MNQSQITRILLLGLIVVTVLLLFRLLKDSPAPEEVVLLDDDFALDDLRVASFEVSERPVLVRLSATGSLQSDSILAAYPWIVRRSDAALVWSLKADEVDERDGTLVSVDKEFELEPGAYDVYFASFGDPTLPGIGPSSILDRISAMMNDDFQKWRVQAGKWHFHLEPASSADQRFVVPVEHPEDHGSSWGDKALTVSEKTVWQTGPMEGNRSMEFLFETVSPIDLRVYAIGEYDNEFFDRGWIEDVGTGSLIWEMTRANTRHAGGSTKNRVCDQVVPLPQGRYRAAYRTNGKHDYKYWTGNPPYDPSGWGLRLDVVNENDLQSVSAFDPWESLPRVASLIGIGDDRLVSHSFSVEQPLRVLVQALGEGFPKQGEMYDYAWIIDGNTKSHIWEMRVKKTQHAGGAYKNRRAETVLDLEPGVPYTVYYKSDDSHSFPNWNMEPPKHPERWGVTIFSLDQSYVPVDIDPELNKPMLTGTVTTEGLVIALAGLGDNVQVQESFTLDDTSRIRIYAVGELTRDGQYDYGWIVDNASDQRIWEMTRDNTMRAGGTSKNRRFDGSIELPAGSYTVHFQTDDTHSFPEFKYGGPPDNPAAWGITLEIVTQRDEQESE